MSEDALDALKVLTAFLERQRVGWMAIGGIAVRALAIPRPTYDVDVLVSIDVEDVGRFADSAEREGFEVPDEHRRGFADSLAGLRKLALRVPVRDRLVTADIFLAATPYQRAAFDRRMRVTTEDGPLYVATPEDLLLHKLLADRNRDRSDIDDLLLVVGPLDEPYLERWAAHLGISDRLDRALRAAGRRR